MNERISEVEFKEKSEQAILDIERAFGELAEQRDIDVEVEGGVLTLTFEEWEPGKFIQFEFIGAPDLALGTNVEFQIRLVGSQRRVHSQWQR